MTNEERDIISQFVARVGGQPQQSSGFGSVPATVPARSLPPVDPEADRFIADQFGRSPEASYRITQMALVQEAALAEAQNRINRLQWELDQARQQQAASSPQPQPQQSKGLFGSLFGGGSSQPQPQTQQAPPQYQQAPPQYQQAPPYQQQSQYAPPPPQYPPNYQPGMFQRNGSGFLGSALSTAAGVAGGVVVGNALMDMFSGHHGGGFGGGGFGNAGPTNETIINNYNDPAQGTDPWANQGAVPGADWASEPGPVGQDAWSNAPTPPDPGFDTAGNFDPGQGSGGGWDDGGGGFDDNSGGSDDQQV